MATLSRSLSRCGQKSSGEALSYGVPCLAPLEHLSPVKLPSLDLRISQITLLRLIGCTRDLAHDVPDVHYLRVS